MVNVGTINIKCDCWYNDSISVKEYLKEKRHISNEINKLYTYCKNCKIYFDYKVIEKYINHMILLI